VNESGGGGCTFEQEKDGGYKLTAGDPEEETSYVFAVRVASLNGRSFVDAILKEMTIRGKRADDDGFMIPVHYFGTIEVDGDQLHIRLLGSDWLKAALKDGRTDLRHEVIEQDPILTAASKDLQDFAFRYAWDQEAFSYTLDFWRRKPTK
jgi:hypothetical protein